MSEVGLALRLVDLSVCERAVPLWHTTMRPSRVATTAVTAAALAAPATATLARGPRPSRLRPPPEAAARAPAAVAPTVTVTVEPAATVSEGLRPTTLPGRVDDLDDVVAGLQAGERELTGLVARGRAGQLAGVRVAHVNAEIRERSLVRTLGHAVHRALPLSEDRHGTRHHQNPPPTPPQSSSA